ncbi:MAG TPA: cobalamin-binding protein [Candidatus Binataceae bacterium]|jgi:iron complex transport system substrate-binding protein|nr:cobalamin-binding protein [Candidatus Binataceae bacterium]
MHRIVSLLPSATEIVCALGFEADLVGRSHECDYPPGVERLPVLTAPKFNPERPSADVDREVRRIVGDALSIYRVDTGKLRELAPDVIVTQSQCEVCAVSERDVEEAVAGWLGERPRIVSLKPYRLSDIFADIERAARALGQPARGAAVVGELSARMDAVAARTRRIRERPRVACIEWLDPLMAAGNWMPELVEMAGGENLFGAPGEHSGGLDYDALVASDPDLIVAAPCGFTMRRTLEELPALAARPGWAAMRAVREGRVFAAEGSQYFNRPGPRIAESLEILAEIIHPGLFRFGYEGRAWRRAA